MLPFEKVKSFGQHCCNFVAGGDVGGCIWTGEVFQLSVVSFGISV